MPLSLQSIRELNKVHFYVTCCADPAPFVLQGRADDASGVSEQVFGANAWSFGMFQSGGLSFGSFVKEPSNAWGGLDALLQGGSGSSGIWKKVGAGLQYGLGIVPQVDYAHKYSYSGTNPVSFDLSCYLVLESDVVQDFFAPLVRLLFLTYPTRRVHPIGSKEAVANMVGSVWGKKERLSGKSDAEAAAASQSAAASVLRAYDKAKEVASDFADALGYKDSVVESFVNWVSGEISGGIGSMYFMEVPPPFRSHFSGDTTIQFLGSEIPVFPVASGTGLALSYGNTYIPNIYFRSMSVSIPELYYEGGFPQVMEVKLSCSTIRVATADSLYGSITGRIE